MNSINTILKNIQPPLRVLLFTLLLIGCMNANGQLNNGGFHAQFGIDADTRAGALKYGPVTGLINSDDWFGPATGIYRGLIDTTNSTYYKAQLQADRNISFIKKMSMPLYSMVNGTTWLDAVYNRDYITSASKDSSAFISANKNGDDPAIWQGGVSTVPNKNDFIDVYAHLRRNGLTVTDSLWFFTGVSTLGVTGNRLFDIELFKNKVTYTSSTGQFSTGGPEAGHSAWTFDALGNITQTGDLIISVSYSGGGVPPVIEVRIWVSKTTHLTTIPTLFNFGANFDGASGAALFGYAEIVSKTGGTSFGSGIGNYSAVPTADTTYSTPWGTTVGSAWAANYEQLQFVEIGINLTRIGIDPALYVALGTSACDATFRSLFFKSRTSNSFTSSLSDFAGPLAFLQPPLDHTIVPVTLSCGQTTGNLTVLNNSGYLTWRTLNGGNITGSNADSTQVIINKPGKYIVNAAAADGCAVGRTDTLTITADSIQPVATANFTYASGPWTMQLLGGDTAASNGNTPYGNSQGLQWSWSGPASFSSTLQNPTVIEPNGTYQLIITEQRNGCRDTASLYLNFMVLSSVNFKLTGTTDLHQVKLSWKMPKENVVYYSIERKIKGNAAYETIEHIEHSNSLLLYSFSDKNPYEGSNSYRIKAVTNTGNIIYSNVITINYSVSGNGFAMYFNQHDKKLYLPASLHLNETYKVSIYNPSGQLLFSTSLLPNRTTNALHLEKITNHTSQLLLVSVNNNSAIISGKLLIK